MKEHEILDLVDKRDRVIGTVMRGPNGIDKTNGYLRAAELFIQNGRGELFIPTRKS